MTVAGERVYLLNRGRMPLLHNVRDCYRSIALWNAGRHTTARGSVLQPLVGAPSRREP